jgi:hypothetical protein
VIEVVFYGLAINFRLRKGGERREVGVGGEKSDRLVTGNSKTEGGK